MTILGLDWGKRMIGVSLSHGSFTQSLTSISAAEPLVAISKICVEQKVDLIVIGLPEGRLVKQIQQFGQNLEKSLKIKVVYWDETLTSQAAREQLKISGLAKKSQPAKEHAVAASIMLQSYLDAKG